MNLNNPGCTNSNRKLKGFTLIEMLVVIAIIAVLAGMLSIALSGFRRDALIETQNDNARMVFTAFQDILIDCEIKQDKSLFDTYEYNGSEGGEMIGAWVFFRISDKDINGNKMLNPGVGLGDEIHINTMFSSNVTNGMGGGPLTGLSVWAENTTQNGGSGYNDINYSGYGQNGGAHIWKKWETAVTGRIDPSMEGTYCVMMDLQNYEVVSVVCRNLVDGRDPKTGLWDETEVDLSRGGFVLKDYTYNGNVGVVNADYVTPIGGSDTKLPLGAAFVKNVEAERSLAKQGVYVGSYPLFDDAYTAYHN